MHLALRRGRIFDFRILISKRCWFFVHINFNSIYMSQHKKRYFIICLTKSCFFFRRLFLLGFLLAHAAGAGGVSLPSRTKSRVSFRMSPLRMVRSSPLKTGCFALASLLCLEKSGLWPKPNGYLLGRITTLRGVLGFMGGTGLWPTPKFLKTKKSIELLDKGLYAVMVLYTMRPCTFKASNSELNALKSLWLRYLE